MGIELPLYIGWPALAASAALAVYGFWLASRATPDSLKEVREHLAALVGHADGLMMIWQTTGDDLTMDYHKWVDKVLTYLREHDDLGPEYERRFQNHAGLPHMVPQGLTGARADVFSTIWRYQMRLHEFMRELR